MYAIIPGHQDSDVSGTSVPKKTTYTLLDLETASAILVSNSSMFARTAFILLVEEGGLKVSAILGRSFSGPISACTILGVIFPS